MSHTEELDPELVGPLSKASHQELERIVEYLDASPVIFIKSEKIYKENKDDLTKIYHFIAEKILAAGGYGVGGFQISQAKYKDIVLLACETAKLQTQKFLTVQELENKVLFWAFENAKNLHPSLPGWIGRSKPAEELASFTRSSVIFGFKNPDFLNQLQDAFNDANEFLAKYIKILMQYANFPLNYLINPKMKTKLPTWILSALASTATLVEGVTAGGAGGAVAASGAVAAGAYAGLLSLYIALAFAGPTTAALFPVVFEIALLRFKE